MTPTRGLTLVELIVGFGILMPVIMVAIGIFPFAHLVDHEASELAAAYDVARTQIESIRNTSFDAIPSTSTVSTVTDGTIYTCQTTVTPYAGTPTVMLKKIDVVVTWKVSKNEQIELDSLVARTSQ